LPEVKNNREVILINQDSGYLMIDIANALCMEFGKVFLVTGNINIYNTELNQSIEVVKITRYNRKNRFYRIYSWLLGTLQVLLILIFKFRNQEILFTSNPPTIILVPFLIRRKFSLLLFDIYPDGLVSAKFLSRESIFHKIWSVINKNVFNRSKAIITLTKGMAQSVSSYTSEDKIKVISAWSAFDAPCSISPNENIFIRRYNLEGKYLVSYSGNLGKEYEVESLINLANAMKENDKVFFVISGNGWKDSKIEDLIRINDLHNCLKIPSQPKEIFTHMLIATYIGIIFLPKSISKVAIPSKVYNLISNEKPVLCIGDKISELSQMVSQYDIGITFDSDEIEGMRKYIERLIDNKMLYNRYIENTRRCSNDHSSENALRIAYLVSADS
jgi:hypothetical protein